jgi:DNA-binding transcriptional regulator YdaS (Cro superfamily)
MKLFEYVNERRGNQNKLAKALHLTPVLVHQWASGKRRVPAERCRDIEVATNGEVKCSDLRPDIFCDNKNPA